MIRTKKLLNGSFSLSIYLSFSVYTFCYEEYYLHYARYFLFAHSYTLMIMITTIINVIRYMCYVQISTNEMEKNQVLKS